MKDSLHGYLEDVRDVYLDEFADTDDELEDEDAEERELRRAERQDVSLFCLHN